MNRSKMRSRFERADLLAAGLALCSFLLVEKFSVKVWLLIMWVILRRRQPLALALITLLFGCSFLLRAPLPASAPDTQIIRVEQIKSSYVIAEAKGQRVVVYGLKQPSFGDIVRVSGTWKQLHSDHNFGQFSFDDYMAKRGVRYRISSEESETLSQGNTLRARLFRQAWQSEGKSRELLLSLIYGIQEEGSYLLSACGLHLSSLAHWLKKLAGKRLAKRQSQAAAVIFLALAGSLTNFSDSLFRVLCTQMAGLLPGSKRDAAGLSILLVLLFRPYMVSEMSFVLPTVLRLAFFVQSFAPACACALHAGRHPAPAVLFSRDRDRPDTALSAVEDDVCLVVCAGAARPVHACVHHAAAWGGRIAGAAVRCRTDVGAGLLSQRAVDPVLDMALAQAAEGEQGPHVGNAGAAAGLQSGRRVSGPVL